MYYFVQIFLVPLHSLLAVLPFMSDMKFNSAPSSLIYSNKSFTQIITYMDCRQLVEQLTRRLSDFLIDTYCW